MHLLFELVSLLSLVHVYIQPVLTQIVQGSLPSNYHKWFVAGSRNEQAKLKVAHKYGPLQKWPDKKVTRVSFVARCI